MRMINALIFSFPVSELGNAAFLKQNRYAGQIRRLNFLLLIHLLLLLLLLFLLVLLLFPLVLLLFPPGRQR